LRPVLHTGEQTDVKHGARWDEMGAPHMCDSREDKPMPTSRHRTGNEKAMSRQR
jgi:hypothetical protein